MPYFEFLIAFKKKDMKMIDEILDTELHSSIVSVEGGRRNLDRAAVLDLIENKINITDHWDFDIVYKTNVRDRIIAFIEVHREKDGKGGKREKVVWFMTFYKRGDGYKLVRLYAEELI